MSLGVELTTFTQLEFLKSLGLAIFFFEAGLSIGVGRLLRSLDRVLVVELGRDIVRFLMTLLLSVYTLHIATAVSRHICIAMPSAPLAFAPMVSCYVAILIAYVKAIGSVYTKAFSETTLVITGLSIVLLISNSLHNTSWSEPTYTTIWFTSCVNQARLGNGGKAPSLSGLGVGGSAMLLSSTATHGTALNTQ
uniref:Uncharacterized protein n=1 Tax=Ignisphaera aggregans TaxID=334771 RepID=A0A7C4BD25_9CREN